ncbi:hypothetical protein [Brevibacterium aurantiacum]|uniref:hypothetical protein n=1 Tax=Brevibacterium aurantiacum TaxID=273384 RepID=UPI003F93A3F1
MSDELIDELIDELQVPADVRVLNLREVITYLDNRGCLKDPGTEIDPDDLQKGDRYRVEYDYVHHNRLEVITGEEAPRKKLVRRHTVEQILGEGSPEPMFFSGDSTENERYFLLERAEPELPSTWGTVATFRSRKNPGPGVQAVYGKDGKWRGIDVCMDADLMAERFRLIEVLS